MTLCMLAALGVRYLSSAFHETISGHKGVDKLYGTAQYHTVRL